MATYNANSVAHGVSWKISLEAGLDGTGVSMGSDHFTPNCSEACFTLRMLRHTLLCSRLVDVHASLANIKTSMFLATSTFNLFVRNLINGELVSE